MTKIEEAIKISKEIYDLSSQLSASETIKNKALALILLLRQILKASRT